MSIKNADFLSLSVVLAYLKLNYMLCQDGHVSVFRRIPV